MIVKTIWEMVFIKTYSKLITLVTFEERLKYLLLNSYVGEPTFGPHRYLNQNFYKSNKWKEIRRQIIIRDDGCDLGCSDYPLSKIYIHHIEPITVEDILKQTKKVYDLDNLISCSFYTHNMIHYGNSKINTYQVIERKPNDTCPWKE